MERHLDNASLSPGHQYQKHRLQWSPCNRWDRRRHTETSAEMLLTAAMSFHSSLVYRPKCNSKSRKRWFRFPASSCFSPTLRLPLRDTSRAKNGQNTNFDKVPALLKDYQQARQVDLSIYKIHLDIMGCSNLWQTYLLAEHDIPALCLSNLEMFVAMSFSGTKAGIPRGIVDVDHEILVELATVSLLVSQRSPVSATSIQTAPNLKNLFNRYLTAPSALGVRGDLNSVK
ncbi:hypothetical protein VTK26DRAFT_4659 [Humicola hyalothermophila]